MKGETRMSDYSDIWYKIHQEQFVKEAMANKARHRMRDELSIKQKIDIIFGGIIEGMPDYKVIDLGQKLLKEEEK